MEKDMSTEYRAIIHPAGNGRVLPTDHIWESSYPVPLKDGSTLEIPLTPLPGGEGAIALLMSNQCDFTVTDRLASLMAEEAAAFAPDCIAAVPTMGLEYASLVARKLGHGNYVAMGFSRKFWYDADAYEEIRSSTSGSQVKRLYLDPHILHRIKGRRVLVVDDVINTGASAAAAVRLLKKLGAEVAGTLVVLTEGRDWERTMRDPLIADSATVRGIGHIPLFLRHEHGWRVDKATL